MKEILPLIVTPMVVLGLVLLGCVTSTHGINGPITVLIVSALAGIGGFQVKNIIALFKDTSGK